MTKILTQEEIDKIYDEVYDKTLLDQRFDHYIATLVGNKQEQFNETEAKYATYVARLVTEEDWEYEDAIKHVVSKDWDKYWDEIYDRALDDDYDSDTAETIANSVANPMSGIEYEECCVDF